MRTLSLKVEKESNVVCNEIKRSLYIFYIKSKR
jgi:hypothetical protein